MPGLCGSELSTDWIFSFITPVPSDGLLRVRVPLSIAQCRMGLDTRWNAHQLPSMRATLAIAHRHSYAPLSSQHSRHSLRPDTQRAGRSDGHEAEPGNSA